MAVLLPVLPQPRIGEWMTVRGIRIPGFEVLAVPNTLSILASPKAVLEGIEQDPVAPLPSRWIDAHRQHRQRLARSTQLLGLHSACLRAEVGSGAIPSLTDCDGVVAGLLLLLLRPRLGDLRAHLMRATTRHPFASYLATHGMLVEAEHRAVIRSIASDTRLSSALVRRDPAAADNLSDRLYRSNDVWSAVVVLETAEAQTWLCRVVNAAAPDPIAAATAITLQPSSQETLQHAWLTTLQEGEPESAYAAARWSKATWPPARWAEVVRNTLRSTATSDLGRFYFLWYRDVEPERADDALQNEGLDLLWGAELTDASKNCGQALRRRCEMRLKANPDDTEAKLVLRWLAQREQGH
jgi:hypothetical protein